MEREDRHTKQREKKAIHSTELELIFEDLGVDENSGTNYSHTHATGTAIKRPKIMGLYLYGTRGGSAIDMIERGGGVDVKSEHEYGDTGVQECGVAQMGKGHR